MHISAQIRTKSCYCCHFAMFLDLELSLPKFHSFCDFFFDLGPKCSRKFDTCLIGKTGLKKSKNGHFSSYDPLKLLMTSETESQNPKTLKMVESDFASESKKVNIYRWGCKTSTLFFVSCSCGMFDVRATTNSVLFVMQS